MATWEPVNVDSIDRDGIREEDDKWDDGKITEIEAKLEELRHFKTLQDWKLLLIRTWGTLHSRNVK